MEHTVDCFIKSEIRNLPYDVVRVARRPPRDLVQDQMDCSGKPSTFIRDPVSLSKIHMSALTDLP